MKKRTLGVVAIILALLLALSACSAGSSDSAQNESMDSGAGVPQVPQEGESVAEDMAETEEALPDSGAATVPLSEKIIYSAEVQIETKDFETSIQAVERMVEEYKGFFESSSVSGNSYSDEYYGYTGSRYAEYVIRIPVESYDQVTGSLDAIGNVLNVYSYTDNITEQFYDSQSRLEAYEIEEERLLSMLEQAETVTDMLDIESRLSQVRYEIESLETRLRNWQNQIDYSTVRLYIREVRTLTEREDPDRSYWQQLGDGFVDTLEDVGGFFKDLFRVIVSGLPIIVLVAVAVVVVVVLIRRRRKKRADSKIQTEEPDGKDKE